MPHQVNGLESAKAGEQASLDMPPTERSLVRHGRENATYSRDDVNRLIDDLKLGHMAFVVDGKPVVVPMTFWRVDSALYFHVGNKSRLQKLLEAGQEVCISFAESKEWVMSKSAYHHSTNYRSAVIYCTGERISDEAEFDAAFAAFIEQIEEGRWEQVRPPNEVERKATALMKLRFDEGSFKSRTGGPNEEPEDMDLPIWNGTMPVCPVHLD